jgi:hypothetical protein
MPYGTRSGRMAYSSPPWLQGPYGLSWNAGIGAGLDGLLADAKAAVKARMPLEAAGNADDEALAQLGDDSRLPRYPAETAEQYGARLQARWQTYDRAGAAPRASDGTGCPILDDLAGLGFGDITLMEYQDWPAWSGDPEVHESPDGWYDTAGAPWWSRFWIYIGSYQGVSIPAGVLMGTGVMGAGIMGTALPSDVISSAVASGLTWKPAHVLWASIGWLLTGTTTASLMGLAVMGSSVMGPGSGSGIAYQTIME